MVEPVHERTDKLAIVASQQQPQPQQQNNQNCSWVKPPKDRIVENTEDKSCSTTSVDPKTVFEYYLEPKNSPLGSQKVKNNAKMKSQSKVRIERNIEDKSCSTT